MKAHTERPRYHTAPSRLRKRDVPAVWDLFALDDRANQDRANDDDDASSVASLSHPPSIASFDSEHTQMSEGMPPFVDRGGSWPRVRKQRTSDMGSSMSLFEVAEALDVDNTEADLASLAQLVAEEEAEQSAAPTDQSGVSIESFVDAVFSGIPPGATATAKGGRSTSRASSGSATPHYPSVSLAGAPPPLTLPAGAAHARPSRAHTANELALLEAFRHDEALNAASAVPPAAVPQAGGSHASTAAAPAHVGGARVGSAASSPTFAACVGALDMTDDPQAPLIEADDVVCDRPPPPRPLPAPLAQACCPPRPAHRLHIRRAARHARIRSRMIRLHANSNGTSLN